MRRLIRDPLVHFLLVGVLVFAVLAPGSDEGEPELIRLSAARVSAALAAAGVTAGDIPLEAAEELIAPLVREEVLYREALALGLDENDDEVRRRLVEKMGYLSEDLADPDPASDAELEAFYDASPERFTVPALATFAHVYFDPRIRTDRLEADMALAMEALAAGGSPDNFGDRTPLRDRYEDVPRDQVEILFGAQIAEFAFAGEQGAWAGPFVSDFGRHLVLVEGRAEPYLPAYEDIAEEVRLAYGEDRRSERNEATFAEMRSRYEIVIEWPDNVAGAGE